MVNIYIQKKKDTNGNRRLILKEKCRNIATDKHSLHINPNGFCDKCQIIKDRKNESKIKKKGVTNGTL